MIRSVKPGVLIWSLLPLFLPACDRWKKADADVATLFAQGVDCVEYEGRKLIRLRNKQAVVIVDPIGAAVVDFHRQVRPKVSYETDPKGGDKLVQVKHEHPAQPNVLGPGGWSVATDPDRPALPRPRHRHVGTDRDPIALLSQTVQGVRQRTVFLMHPPAVVEVTVELTNLSWQPVDLTARTQLNPAGQPRPAQGAEHYYADKQWFSRQILSPPPAKPVTLKPRQSVTWTERWWITPDSLGQTPPGPPQVR